MGALTQSDLGGTVRHMHVANARAHPIPFVPPKNGAMVGQFMAASYYPLDEEDSGEQVKTSIRLSAERHEDIQLIAELWNEIDQQLGRQRARRWKAASVIQRLIHVGIDGFWQQVGGRPTTKQDRQAFIATAVERLRTKPSKK